MRISDWSSDVCSSDLSIGKAGQGVAQHLVAQAMLGFHFGGAVAQRDLDAAPVGHANEADREMARARRFIDGPAIVSDLASVIFGKADEELQEIALFKNGDHFQRQTDRT